MTTRANPFAHLVNTLQADREILVFLGAGSSTDGLQGDGPFPDFQTLVNRVLHDEGIAPTENPMTDFLEVMRRWERESSLSVRLGSYLTGTPGLAHLQLASVTMSLFPDVDMTVYLTTNFDDLMFKALSAVSKNSPERDPKVFSLRRPAVINEIADIFRAIPSHTRRGTPVVIKLFGDLASTSPIFAAEDMPFDEFTEEKLIRLLDRTTLFIGYGFHDAPILRLLVRSASTRPVFVVSPVNPITEQLVQISQREFYWLPKRFSEFVSDLIATFSANNPSFDAMFAAFLHSAGIGEMTNSPRALCECARNASAPALARFLNRNRGAAASVDDAFARGVLRPDTGPDFETFRNSEARILAIVGESGSGKSTLLFQIYDCNAGDGADLHIYYDAQSLQSSGSIAGRLALDFAVEPAKVQDTLRQIAATIGKKGGNVFIFIDALNESSSVDALTIRYELESLAGASPGNVRFLYSCRRVFWDARMTPANDLPREIYADRKVFVLSKFSHGEARSAYEHYRGAYGLKSEYDGLSASVREHIRDPLMLRFVSEAYRDAACPQFAPAVLVFREILAAVRRRYRHTPLLDFLDSLIDGRLEQFAERGDVDDVFHYRTVRTDGSLALLAQQQLAGPRHAEHPLTILEDENIITPLDAVAARFRFTYERFYEYLLGLRLHYDIFGGPNVQVARFIELNLPRFRDAHYSFYQGLKSAFVMEFLSDADPERRREMALLAHHADPSIAAFGKDILREVIFESGESAAEILELISRGYASTASLILDLGFESEGVLPYALKGLFDQDLTVRRRSVRCLLFHVQNLGSLHTMNAMVLHAAKSGNIGRETLARGLVYYFAVGIGGLRDKSEALRRMQQLVWTVVAEVPDRVDLDAIAAAMAEVIATEGPQFFGANYDAAGLLYPWRAMFPEVRRHRPAVRALLFDTSPQALKRHLDAVLFFSDIQVQRSQDLGSAQLFAFQIEYRIVQWAFIRAWADDSVMVLELLDTIVERGQPFNIDFALGVVEDALFRTPGVEPALVLECHERMVRWTERFESRFPEFYLCLSQPDPFAFNLAPLAVLAHVEARFFTSETGVIPCIARWLADPSPDRRKMALLAANWLAGEFPSKVLNTLEPTIQGADLEQWYDRVLAGYEKTAPRLLDDFFNKLRFPMRRRTSIRTHEAARSSEDIQYHGEWFFAWLFLGPQSRLRGFMAVYDMIYATPSPREFCLNLLRWWSDAREAVE